MKRKVVQKKVTVLAVILGLIFMTLSGRLAYLQLLETQRFQGLAQDNLVRIIPITAPRGEIRDRNGELLVDNKPVYTLSLSFLGVSKQEQRQVEQLLAQILSRDKNVGRDASLWLEEIEKQLEKQTRPFEPVKVAVDVAWETVVQVRERQTELPGVIVEEEPVRNYPNGEMLAHVLGYVREMNDKQLEAHKDEGYRMGDQYGQDGLENAFEKYLRGEKGARQVEVDANGRPVDVRGVKKPVPGSNLVLTIDSRLQKAAEQALAEGIKRVRQKGFDEAKAGAAVVLDVNTGAVLAMASYPSYHPSIFADLLSEKKWQELKEMGALVNRAIRPYPPGSIFKMVTAAAILENDIVDPEHSIYDPGYYMLGPKRFTDWKPGGHGRVDLRKALQVSCDVYFWKYGRAAGHREIARYAREFGLGEKTGIELPGEWAGVVPTPEYKRENVAAYLKLYNPEFVDVREKYERMIKAAEKEEQKKKLVKKRDKELEELLNKYKWHLEWQTYDTLNISIGQGDNWYTPLQLAGYVAAIANGGTLYKPYIVKKIIGPEGYTRKVFRPEVRKKVDVSAENLKIIQEGMHMVTLPPAGTAAWIFNGFPLPGAAKTGTAEVAGHDNHALFAAYVPFEKPEIAVVAVVEYGDSGSAAAGPVVRDILDAYYEITRGGERDDEGQPVAENKESSGQRQPATGNRNSSRQEDRGVPPESQPPGGGSEPQDVNPNAPGDNSGNGTSAGRPPAGQSPEQNTAGREEAPEQPVTPSPAPSSPPGERRRPAEIPAGGGQGDSIQTPVSPGGPEPEGTFGG